LGNIWPFWLFFKGTVNFLGGGGWEYALFVGILRAKKELGVDILALMKVFWPFLVC